MLYMSNQLSEPHEDYLERIYELFTEKEFVRAVDVAERLGISSASVTKMLQKLANEGYLTVEKYRGFVMTQKGKLAGSRIQKRHQILESFLRSLGVSETVVQKDVEGLEHHISQETLEKIEQLVKRQ